MAEYKDPEFTFLHEGIKTTTYIEQLSLWMIWKLAEWLFSNQHDKERTMWRLVRGEEK